ncbi:MAG TPA: sulfur carrier protein ThiS [Candidatus Limousia pullorum]|uniref:Sulfur carrier protein ThiS n=1 Tax=Candidatus Limousia pullorum TaxID=2840860 RepID=A0A9D1LYN2_9FIRM|nr:sulfur carrier protein ThiS [Anaeromassilibacillus sp. An172]MCI6495911.1 sulfur carrier protein ThiS [Anaeromassilibacillus sp.]MDY3780478.1 sulfur carrier protein ThiS [Candidatus Limousia pullorum]MEE0762872.1 sulfur carrier protein ThiS [Acutalibacteraceae bacterium]OUP76961.1 thiamine biosynthesis protein ThiS [Anaeromassilibacillus sp. An172]HIU50358.1 sulfur carrier protein ThiS [Candidatus Limousia pullorum]
MVKINGQPAEAAGKTVAQIVEEQGLNVQRVAVELNGDIVKRSDFDKVVVKEDDSMEIVNFVGGG